MIRAKIVLASASARRRELLAAAGVEFEVRPANVDENLEAFADPLLAASRLACKKARAGAASEAGPGASVWVIGADTVVAVRDGANWRLLGKAESDREAEAMLSLLSGTRHLVATGVSVVRCSDRAEWTEVERTWVTMRAIGEDERRAYVASGEWRDKAGGYAIQESADRFVTGLEEGGFDNVVGLPVALTLRLLRASGALDPGRSSC